MRNSWDRVLPYQLFSRNLFTEVAHTWPHITMSKLKPCTGKGICKLIRIRRQVANTNTE